jgi:uncharacterized hydrophobic protein (TIGR00271 family)
MRLVYVLVADDERDAALDALDGEGIDYVLTREAEREATLVRFPLPAQAVEAVLADLREAGVPDEFVVVTSAETAETPGFEDLRERYVERAEEGEAVLDAEIESKVRGLSPGRGPYYAMTLLSVVVATAGLLLDAPAVVVGSMVMAPQVGSALTASVGLVFDDRAMVVRGFRAQIAGLAAAVVAAAALGVLLKRAGLVPTALDVATVTQVSARTSPGALSTLVGLCAGAAGAFGISTDVPVSLVGVAVAAALIPAAAAVGIGVAWGAPLVALGALVLLVVNLLTVTLAGAAVLWGLGYRPPEWEPGALGANVRAGRLTATLAALVVLSAATLAAGAPVAGHTAFENEVNRAAASVLAEPDYRALELVSLRTAFAGPLGAGGPRSVTAVVRHPAGESYPALPGLLRERIRERTGRPVAVSVELVANRQVGPERLTADPRPSGPPAPSAPVPPAPPRRRGAAPGA